VSGGVTLAGCTVEPMAGYLKALAVFRLVAEQADSSARGSWRGNAFCLDSCLDEAGLVEFFLDEYTPTPIVAPWNGSNSLDAIATSSSIRFAEYRRTIQEVASWSEVPDGEMTVGAMVAAIEITASALRPGKKRTDLLKLVADFDGAAAASGVDRNALLQLTATQIETTARSTLRFVKKLVTAVKKTQRAAGKEETVRTSRNRLPDAVVDWIDSAVVLRSATELSYPPILGTGGNEGRLDYTSSFMERVSSLLLKDDRAVSESLIRNALFGCATNELSVASFGQLDPGRAGGYNLGPGIETKNFPTNPWDFVLAMEGAVAWASGAGRRQAANSRGVMASPFTVRSRAVGYGSAEDKDQEASRAEVWMPIWARPCSFEELRTLLREGRAEWSGKPVGDAVEFAEAAASLGTDRGIDAFQRFSLIKRRGDSYLALPLDRVPVRQRQGADCLEEVDDLLSRLDYFASRFKSIPAQFSSCRRQIDAAIYDFALRGGKPRLLNVLIALGQMERYLAGRGRQADPQLDRPLSGLTVHWIEAADDGSIEFRIAAAIASIRASGNVGPVRANLSPVSPGDPNSWTQGSDQVAWEGPNLPARMISLLKRRMTDAERLNGGGPVPLRAEFAVSPEDIAAFIEGGSVDESRLEALIFACTLIDWKPDSTLPIGRPTETGTPIPRSYALLKHLFQGNVRGREIKPEPSILSQLVAGRVGSACETAQRRLRISDLHPVMASFPMEPRQTVGLRLAASLLIPVNSIESLSQLVLRKQNEDAT
jgi:CRISPR-associated protein Csx17